MNVRARIQQASNTLANRLRDHLAGLGNLCIIKAPPGSGKTFTLLQAVAFALNRGSNVAVATQTNAQADDACRRLLRDHPGLDVWRFAADGAVPPADFNRQIHWVTKANELPSGSVVVVSTTAKWSLVDLLSPFDMLFVDEAWQMAWADFMLLQQVAPRFVLIGDPGQIPPVVSIPVHRWETSPRAPHQPAPELILLDNEIPKLSLELPSCRRLPADSVELVRPFYDFDFDAWALPGERFVKAKTVTKSESIDRVIDVLAAKSAAIATLPTPSGGPPLELDVEIATLAARIARRLLERQARSADSDGGKTTQLKPADIGIAATHRVMNSAIVDALPRELRNHIDGIRVDTPERWQGLERKVMLLVHPLSGIVRPSSFDLETGRLCVMASRHRSGMIVISRDHVPETLDMHVPSAEQAVGRPDVTGRGHSQNLRFWQTLAQEKCVLGC